MVASSLQRWVEKHPLASFFTMAFVISWLGMIPMAASSSGPRAVQSPVFALLGGGGPMLAALIVSLLLGNWRGVRGLLAPLLEWRVGIAWYLIALFWPAVVALVAIGLGTSLGFPAPAFGSGGSWFMLMPIFVGNVVLGAPLEEIGWRGFALPRLQSRHGALASSLILGVVWASWHVPLFLQKGNPTPLSSFPLWFVLLLGNAIVYTWIYNNTRGSLLLVILFHAACNTAFPAVPSLLMAGLTWLGIIVIVVLLGPVQLSRRKISLGREPGDETQTTGRNT